jgi:hypothetical protein
MPRRECRVGYTLSRAQVDKFSRVQSHQFITRAGENPLPFVFIRKQCSTRRHHQLYFNFIHNAMSAALWIVRFLI